MKFLEAVANVFKVPDLRKRLLFTLALLAVYRLGARIPIPGIDANRFADFVQSEPGRLPGLLRPVQRRAVPPADHLRAGHHALHHRVHHPAVVDGGGAHAREAPEGRRDRAAQDHSVDPLSDGRPGASCRASASPSACESSTQGFVTNPGFGFTVLTILTLTTGTAFIMWLGEQITERGIGNGMSLIIFVGIVVDLPRAIQEIVSKIQTGDWNALQLIIILTMMVARGRLHRPGGARRAPHSGAIRQARDRAAHDGRTIHPPAAQGQRRRRDSRDLRQFPAGFPADPDRRWTSSRTRRRFPRCWMRSGARSRCITCCTPR